MVKISELLKHDLLPQTAQSVFLSIILCLITAKIN